MSPLPPPPPPGGAQSLGRIPKARPGLCVRVHMSAHVCAWAEQRGRGAERQSHLSFPSRLFSASGEWVPGPQPRGGGRLGRRRGLSGRRHCGQLCRVGASGPALCSVRAWSQTAPLFSCWSCWEAGRLDEGHGLEGETQGARGSLARVCAP